MRAPFAHSIVAVCLAGLALPGEGYGQAEKYEGKRIATIQFIPPQQPLEASELKDILPLKIGQPLRIDDVRATIERLYATLRYTDIQVDAQPYGDELIIRILTQNSWFIGRVGVESDIGSNPNDGQLVNAMRLDLGQPYTDDKLAAAQENVRDLLHDNGLFEADLEPAFQYDNRTQQVHLMFHVKGGRRASYSRPEFKGDLKMDIEKLIRVSKWRRWLIRTWKPVTLTRTRQGVDSIRNQYTRADRLEAKVTLEPLDYDSDTNRVKPVLDIDAGPRVEVRTIGAALSRRRLRDYVPIYEEHTVDRDLLVEGARNLRDYYQSDGYFEVEVEFKEQRVINDRAEIDYLVNTGKRHRLVDIKILGNKYFSTDAIRERMFLRTASFLQFRRGRYSESFLRRDEDSIRDLYQSNGFRDVVVRSRSIDDYKGKTGDIAVFIEITEGAQWFVARLEVEGVEREDAKAILPTLSSQEGQPFSETNVAVDRNTILDYYFTNGYPNATFEWNSRPAAAPNQVDLKFTVREGTREFVREVLIGGLKTTKPALVYRNLELNPGDPLSPTKMTDTQHRLYDLGIFARVDTAIQNPEGATLHKYVLYQMEEARRYSVTGGVGAEFAKIGGCSQCLESPGGQAGFAPRASLDVSRMNLWGIGHSLSMRTRVSTIDRRGLVSYFAPRFRNNDNLNLSFTGLFQNSRDVRTFSSRRLEGSIQLSERRSKATTMFYRYTFRRVSVSSLNIDQLLLPLLTQPVRLGMLSMAMVEDRRDDPIDPRKGLYNTVDLGLAERIFGAQRNFLRFLGRNATYHPLTRNVTLARSTQFGVLHAFNFTGDPLQAIPLPERFFGGGGASQRGFPDNQAGPRDTVTGFPFGGTAQFFNQAEVRFPLLGENIGGVLFHDMGNVYSRLSSLSFRVHQRDLQDFDYMVHAIGFGIRYRTPIGPVRVDLAYSINPPKFVGFNGTQNELLDAGVDPCHSPKYPNRCYPTGISHFQYFFSIGQTF